MQFERVPMSLPEWPSLRAKPEREPGIHISGVIKYIADKLGKPRDSSWDLNTTWRVGLLFEEVLAAMYQEGHAPSLGAILRDGVWFTPDGHDPIERAIQEYKFTWKSARTFATADSFHYMTQIKSYCKVVGVNKATIHILYIMGNYKGGGPEFYQDRYTFTDQELEDNWLMVMRHADIMRQQGIIEK